MTRKSAQAVNTEGELLKDLLTVEEAARVCHVSVSTVLAWIRSGKVPAFYVVNEISETVH